MVDPDMAAHVLQALDDLCRSNPDGPGVSAAAATAATVNQQQGNLGSQFTEILVNDKDAISFLLGLLEPKDFYTRHHTMDLLKTLLENAPGKLQEGVLVAPNGVSRIVDLLDDPREAIRNGNIVIMMNDDDDDYVRWFAFTHFPDSG